MVEGAIPGPSQGTSLGGGFDPRWGAYGGQLIHSHSLSLSLSFSLNPHPPPLSFPLDFLSF